MDRPFRPARSPRRRRVVVVAAAVAVAVAAAGWQATRSGSTSGNQAKAPGRAKARSTPPLGVGRPVDPGDPEAAATADDPAAGVDAAGLRAYCPDGTSDEWLTAVARRYGPTADGVAKAHRLNGLVVLAEFGPDAADLFRTRPEAFARLVEAAALSPARRALVAGPWQRFALRWAAEDKLARFLGAVAKLPDEQVELALRHPAALPVLCRADAPSAHDLIDRYGAPVLDLLLAVDASGHPDELEAVARGIKADPELVMTLAADYGPAMAFLLIPPPRGGEAAAGVGQLARHALASGLDREEGLALILTCLPALLADLGPGAGGRPPVPVATFREAVGRYRNLPPLVRLMAADHPLTLRLLADDHDGVPLGVRVMEACGPAVADLVYAEYAANDLRPAALAALAAGGEEARRVLADFKGHDGFKSLLRRAAAEKLHLGARPPVATAVALIGRTGDRGAQAEQIDLFLKTANLFGQIERVANPPDPGLWGWVPGYDAVTTLNDWNNGLHVSKLQWGMAALDGAGVVSLGAGAGKHLVAKAAGKTAAAAAGRTAGREALEQAGKRAVAVGQTHADDLARAAVRAHPHLAKLGPQGMVLAEKRVTARASGLTAKQIHIADRGEVWRKLGGKVVDVVKDNPAEVVSDGIQSASRLYRMLDEWAGENAREFAKYVGYEPVHVPTTPHPLGLNLVFRDGALEDGGRVVVIEPLASGRPPRHFAGFEQGTVEYVAAVAVEVRRTAGEPLRGVADLVLDAARRGRLHVERVCTYHRDGVPALVRLVGVVGPQGEIRPYVPTDSGVPTIGLAVRLVADYRTLSQDWPVRMWVQQQADVGRLLGFHTWPRESKQSPLSRPVPGRRGEVVGDLPAAREVGQVGEFAAAVMELTF